MQSTDPTRENPAANFPQHSGSSPVVAAALGGLKLDAEAMAAGSGLLESLEVDEPEQELQAIRRWESQKPKRRRVGIKYFGYLMATLLMTGMVVYGMMDLLGLLPALRREMGADGLDRYLARSGQDTLHNRRLLGLIPPGQTPLQNAKALWDEDPSNPAYFTSYAQAFQTEHRALPPDFEEIAARIDPDNPEFLHWAASAALTYIHPALPDVPKSLRLLHEARGLGERRSYQGKLMQERMRILRPDTPEALNRARTLVWRGRTNSVEVTSLIVAIDSRARKLGGEGDTSGFLSLKEDFDGLLRHLAEGEVMDLDSLRALPATAAACLETFLTIADARGLHAETTETLERILRMQQLQIDRGSHPLLIAGFPPEEKAGIRDLEIMSGSGLLVHPPQVTDAQVRPMRMYDHESLAQFATASLWTGLAAVTLLAYLYSFRSPRLIRTLSARIVLTLRPADWMGLTAMGLLPWFYTMAVLRLTPWGGHDFSTGLGSVDLPDGEQIPLVHAQFGVTFLMMIILLILAARWRLSRRAAFFGFQNVRPASGATAVLCGAAFVPVIGWAHFSTALPWLLVSAALAAVPAAWLLVVVVRSLTTNTRLLHMTTVSRVIFPGCVAMMTLLLLAAPYFEAARLHWFRQSSITRMSPEIPGISEFEHRLELQAQREFREALGN